jgi:hypothetical protein
MRRHVFVLQRIDEGFINFERVDIQILKIAEAGIAGSKIINVNRVPGTTECRNGR